MNAAALSATKTLSQINHRLSQLIDGLLVVITALLIVDVLWGVFSRFALGAQSNWTEELARFALIWLTSLGVASVFRRSEHLSINLLVKAFAQQEQRLAQHFYYLCILIFATFILISGGTEVTRNSYLAQQSMVALPFPKYWQYVMLPLSGFAIALFCIEDWLKLFSASSDFLPKGGN